MITLHYACGTASAEIYQLEFADLDALLEYIVSDLIPTDDGETVYLLTHNNIYNELIPKHQDIFISENIDHIHDYFAYLDIVAEDDYHFFLQEYNSYQAAYDVALLMREGSKLCYDPKKV